MSAEGFTREPDGNPTLHERHGPEVILPPLGVHHRRGPRTSDHRQPTSQHGPEVWTVAHNGHAHEKFCQKYFPDGIHRRPPATSSVASSVSASRTPESPPTWNSSALSSSQVHQSCVTKFPRLLAIPYLARPLPGLELTVAYHRRTTADPNLSFEGLVSFRKSAR